MANLVIVTQGLPSLIYPAVELGRRLAAARHRVTFAGDEHSRDLAAHHDLPFLPLEPSGYDQFLREDGASSLFRRVTQIRARRMQACAAVSVDGIVLALKRVRPDLVLINGEMHEHIIAAVSGGLRVALLNSFVSIWRQPGLPPPHHLARPSVGWKGTGPGMALLWRNLQLRKLRRRWLDRIRFVGCDRVSALRDCARAAGFEASEFDDGQWLIPFTYRRLPVLSLHALEFEFPHRPPQHVHYVGPMVLGSRPHPAESATDRVRLEAVLTSHRAAGGGRRLIYAGFGSVLSTDLAFLRRLVGIVLGRPQWDLVLSLSGRIQPATLGPLPDRVHVFPWVPQVDVLAEADVAITHGGISSIDECVTRGVPVLVYCGGETDMAGTTSRVVHHEIGIAGDRHRDTTSTIRVHLDRLLAEPRFRANLGRLQRSYAAYVENRVAERTVEALLAVQPPRGRGVS
jgi:zeaxanthin glucosyltransferase